MEDKVKKEKVAFTAEQMEIIQSMLRNAKEDASSDSPNKISMYEMRDPTKIETVNVSRFDGKYVLGFKNQQKDKMKKNPKYLRYEDDKSHGFADKKAFITLLLAEDEKETPTEIEVSLTDYVDMREKYQAKDVEIKKKEIIDDFGILGMNGDFAVAVNAQGTPEMRPTVKAEVKREIRVFFVELEGFSKPVEFITDFLS